MEIKKVYGVCPHDCPDSCGVVTEVENGVAVRFYGDPAHQTTDGWLCAKVRPYLDHLYHPERLKYPLLRVGEKGSGEWKRISWEEAIKMIGEKWGEIIATYGAEAILPFSYSGTLGLVQLHVSNGRFWNRLGASQLQRSICGAAAEMAVRATLGARHTQSYEAIVHTKLLIVWGHNPVSTAPHFMPFLRQAQKNGLQLIVIDPRRTRTAKGADWHLAPLPGTDGALALGMAHLLVREGWHNEAWLQAHTVGWDLFRPTLDKYTPEYVAEVTGLTEADIYRLSELYGRVRPGLIKIADGINRNFNGGQTVRAICALPALTGQYGRLGAGLSYSSSGYLKWNDEAVNKWSESPAKGRTINMNRLGEALLGEATDPPIQSLFVFAANPATVNPDAGRVVAGLKREDLFTVVHELFMTDTADYADLVLPATSQLEQVDLHKAYGHTILNYNEAAVAPLGEAKSNWELMTLLAREMGFNEAWLHQSAAEVIDEVFQATKGTESVLDGIELADTKEPGGVQLNVEEIPFANGRFPTPSGKVELYSAYLASLGIVPMAEWVDKQDDGGWAGKEGGLWLVTGAAHHFVSSSLASQKELWDREGEPFLEIHPIDAGARGIEDGMKVRVENGRGWCQLKAVVTDGVRQGVVVSPKGYWSKKQNGRNVNWTSSAALGDMAGQSTFHSNLVWVKGEETI